MLYSLSHWRRNSSSCGKAVMTFLHLTHLRHTGWRNIDNYLTHGVFVRVKEYIKNNPNKKVILRERKKHTVRHVASTRFAEMSPDWGGRVPHPVLDRGVPHQVLTRGYPPSAGWGTPCLDLGWGTPIQTWDGVPPFSRMGYLPPIQTRDGVHPHVQTWDGVLPCKCRQTENITFPHPFGADGNYLHSLWKIQRFNHPSCLL